MIKRSSVIISPKKSKEFVRFIKTNGKTKEYWDDVKKGASKSVDKKELDRLFN